MRVLLTALTCPKGEIGTKLASHLELVGADAGRPFITELLASDGDVVTVHRRRGWAPTRGLTCTAAWSVSRSAWPGSLPPWPSAPRSGPTRPTHRGRRSSSDLLLPGCTRERRRTDEDWRRGDDWWRRSVTADAARLLGPNRWLAVFTQAGATDGEDFPGWAALVGGGRVVAELPTGPG